MENKNICPKCKTEASTNFCANCGLPLTENAIALKKQREKNLKLELLTEVISLVNDPRSLEALKAYGYKLLHE